MDGKESGEGGRVRGRVEVKQWRKREKQKGRKRKREKMGCLVESLGDIHSHAASAMTTQPKYLKLSELHHLHPLVEVCMSLHQYTDHLNMSIKGSRHQWSCPILYGQ